MLELDGDYRDSMYWDARQTGRLIGRVEALISWARKALHSESRYIEYKKSHPEEAVPEKYRNYHLVFEEWCSYIDEKDLEVANYILKYKTLSDESLATKILKETEYWYLS